MTRACKPLLDEYLAGFPCVAERRCRYGLVITNDSELRQIDEAIVAVPFSHL